MRAALGLMLACAGRTEGSGPAGHDAHLAGLERLQRLEATVQALLVAGQPTSQPGGESETHGRRRVQMNMGQREPLGAPSPAPGPKVDADLGMTMGTDMSTMTPMHASLFVFAPEPSGAAGMTVIWSSWSVSTWTDYAATLLVLLLWASGHEWLASVRTAVAAMAASRTSGESGQQKADAAATSDLGESLTMSNPTVDVEHSPPPLAADSSPPAQLIFHVTGMTCDSCATRIEAALKGIAGVLAADVSHAKSSAVVRYEAASFVGDPVATLCDRIGELGFDAAENTAAPTVCYAACSSSFAVAKHPTVDKGLGMMQSEFTMKERRLVSTLAGLEDASGMVLLVLTFLQTLSTYLLMLATMTFEVGVIVVVVLGRSLGQHCIRRRRLGANALGHATGVVDQLECCTS